MDAALVSVATVGSLGFVRDDLGQFVIVVIGSDGNPDAIEAGPGVEKRLASGLIRKTARRAA